MKSDCSAPSWLKFFVSAGIQKDSAETYAVTFSKNQIQLDMLPEIKKEYLVDMGITLMGHIIAILRHAKTVHTEEVTKSTLSTNKTDRNGPSKSSAPAPKPVSKTTPMLVKEKVTPLPTVGDKVASSTSIQSTAKSASSSHQKPTSQPVVAERRKDKQISDLPKPSLPPLPSKTSASRLIESPPKRKLIAEEAANPDESEAKKRIFQRLGHVSSSNPPAESPTTNGVFSRLGDKAPSAPVPEPVATPVLKKITVKPIVSLLKPSLPSPIDIMNDPKKKVMMLNQGYLTKTMRADQDTPSKILSSTSLSAEHTSQTLANSRINRSNIYLRLGKAAMDDDRLVAPPAPKTKKVSFGGVVEKTIPPVQNQQLSNSFSGWSSPSLSVDSPRYRRRQISSANGVFSRLGF